MSSTVTPFVFPVEFGESVALYRGVVRVWIETTGEDAGKLKAEFRTGEIEDLGYASDYAYAVERGYDGTMAEWVSTLLGSAENAQNAYNYKNDAASFAEDSGNSAEDSEAWATGKRGGVDVSSDDDAYHNNSKYYNDQMDVKFTEFSAVLSTATTKYKNSTSGTVAPTDPSGWEASPSPEKGKYVWAKTTFEWADGHLTETYAVTYQGADGEGRVSSVNTKTGAVILYANDIKVSSEDNRGVLDAISDVIDDTAGSGDTNKTWSADKISSAFGSIGTDVGSAIDALQDEIDEAVSTLQNEIEANKTLSVALDTVTNVSGSYSHSTTIQGITSTMKPIAIEYGDSSVFRSRVTIVTNTDEVTLSCNDVVGTSTVTVILMEQQQTEVIPDGNEGV